MIYFNNYHHYNGSTYLVAAILYAVQIYCDFSGYSDIAIGTGRLFSFDLMKISLIHIFQEIFQNFGEDGIYHLPNGYQIYIFTPIQMKYRNLRILGNGIAIFQLL